MTDKNKVSSIKAGAGNAVSVTADIRTKKAIRKLKKLRKQIKRTTEAADSLRKAMETIDVKLTKAKSDHGLD